MLAPDTGDANRNAVRRQGRVLSRNEQVRKIVTTIGMKGMPARQTPCLIFQLMLVDF